MKMREHHLADDGARRDARRDSAPLLERSTLPAQRITASQPGVCPVSHVVSPDSFWRKRAGIRHQYLF
jgi:hypothetical protein